MSKVSDCCKSKFKPFHKPICGACGEPCREVEVEALDELAKSLEAGWIKKRLGG